MILVSWTLPRWEQFSVWYDIVHSSIYISTLNVFALVPTALALP